MTHDEMIAVIQARKDGKTIQFRNHGRVGSSEFQENWTDCVWNDPHWDFSSVDYRVKPRPLRKFVLHRCDKHESTPLRVYSAGGILHECDGESIPVVEVLE